MPIISATPSEASVAGFCQYIPLKHLRVPLVSLPNLLGQHPFLYFYRQIFKFNHNVRFYWLFTTAILQSFFIPRKEIAKFFHYSLCARFFRLFSSANDAFFLKNSSPLISTTGCILCRNWIKSARLSPGSSTPTRATQSFPRNWGSGSPSLDSRAVTHCPYITYILFSPLTCAGDRLLAFLNSANSSLVRAKNLLSLIIFLCVCSFDNNFQPHGVK